MGPPFTPVAIGRQWPLLASLLSAGLLRRPFEAATGLPFGAGRVRCEPGAILLTEPDVAALGEAVAAAPPDFAGGFADACRAAGDRLLATAGAVSQLAGGSPAPGELREAFAAFAEATQAAGPFLVAVPTVRAALEAGATARIAQEPGGIPDPALAAKALRALVGRSEAPGALREVGDFYRMTAAVMADGEALEILRTTSPAVAVNRLRDDFPALYELVRAHARTYAWVGPASAGAGPAAHRCEARPPKELFERLQAVVLRWTRDRVMLAAGRHPAPTPEQALGFTPSGALAAQIAALRALAAAPAARMDVHLQANCAASPIFVAVAEALGCSRDEVLSATSEEVAQALATSSPPAGAGRSPTAFVLERSGDEVTLEAVTGEGGSGNPDADGDGAREEVQALTGMTAARGRAVGTVRVILAAPQVHLLEVGDVLVTATSTPDAMGGESVFPTRAGPPLGIENATAIVTDEGGSLSHAAIVAREQGIPCIVGTEHATSLLSDGQVVEIDATKAEGRIIPLT